VNVRAATVADQASLRELWEAAQSEFPSPDWLPVADWEVAWGDLQSALGQGMVALAVEAERVVGVAVAAAPFAGRSRLELVYLRSELRGRGAASALVGVLAELLAGAGVVSVCVELPEGAGAMGDVWRAVGFEEVARVMAAPLATLQAAAAKPAEGPSHAVIHLKTDDHVSVERAVDQFVPRLAAPVLGAEAGGWIRVHDAQLDGDSEAQGALAADISDRLGTAAIVLGVEHGAVVRYRIYEHGLLVDEYLSVPSFYGELPTVEQLGLVANPTIVSRVTGAPFDDVRRVARNAPSAAELPDAEELYRQIAAMMQVDP
jgi:GNAT superfamily N-acetyltransferase